MSSKFLLTPIACFFVLVLLSPQALAAEIPNFSSMVMKMSWALFVVAGLILILYGLLRKKMGYSAGSHQQIKILEMKQLVNKNALAVVEIRGKQLLIGIGTNAVTLVHELDHPSTNQEETFQKVLDETQ